ncbi:MAG: hypothetical protein QM817_33095 [Archangium sp.]
MSDESEGESGKAGIIISIALTAAVFAGLWAWSTWNRANELEYGEGRLKNALVIPGANPVLLAVESLEFSSEDSDEIVFRLTSYDARTGKRIARKKEVPWRDCAPASEGLAWCYGDDSTLEVITVPALETKWSAAALSAKVGQKIMNVTQLDVSAKGGFRATLADGKKVELDAQTLNATPQTEAAPRKSRPSPKLFDCSIPNTEREGLCTRGQYGAEQRVDTGDGWLRMDVLADVPGGMIIAVNTSLDDAVNERLIVRLDDKLREVGATSLGKRHGYMSHDLVWVTPDELFVLVDKEFDTTIAIDATSGRPAWRVRH